ncbi:MAG: hypothetical protein QOG63_1458 [Thermoleophilaceae bacterium]|jgi:hypothetical protein|nr:hypothetical protein [Thermoleophilaceae bacterium]
MTESTESERPEGDELTGEEREQLAQEGRLQQTEQEESQEDE